MASFFMVQAADFLYGLGMMLSVAVVVTIVMLWCTDNFTVPPLPVIRAVDDEQTMTDESGTWYCVRTA